MDEEVVRVFKKRLSQQCMFALKAVEDWRDKLRIAGEASAKLLSYADVHQQGGPDAVHHAQQVNMVLMAQMRQASDGIPYDVQAFAVAAANVSKVFFSPWKKTTKQVRGIDYILDHQRRGFELRQIFNVDENRSMLRADKQHPVIRQLRDAMEHFDERIDLWASASSGRNIIQSIGGGIDPRSEIDELDLFQILDFQNMTVQVQGTAYPVQPVIDELRDILHKVLSVLEINSRSSSNPRHMCCAPFLVQFQVGWYVMGDETTAAAANVWPPCGTSQTRAPP